MTWHNEASMVAQSLLYVNGMSFIEQRLILVLLIFTHISCILQLLLFMAQQTSYIIR
jgi:hypothetical protein